MSKLTRFINSVNRMDKARPKSWYEYGSMDDIYIAELRNEGIFFCQSAVDNNMSEEERHQFEATNGVLVPYEHVFSLYEWLAKLMEER